VILQYYYPPGCAGAKTGGAIGQYLNKVKLKFPVIIANQRLVVLGVRLRE
jgi:hypothetical protein